MKREEGKGIGMDGNKKGYDLKGNEGKRQKGWKDRGRDGNKRQGI